MSDEALLPAPTAPNSKRIAPGYFGHALRLVYSMVRQVYTFIFARPSMQSLNNAVLKLALHGRGYNNHGFVETGEEVFLRLLSKHNPQLCIDIGANKGNYSRSLLERTKSRVIAFEPLPAAFIDLSKLQQTFPNRLIAVNKGVGERNAELNLHFGDRDSEFASFSKEVNEIDYVGRSNRNTVKVEVVTLDSFFTDLTGTQYAAIDLLKIDTEGFEHEVLIGAKYTIEKRKPKFIQIEYNWHQLFKAQSLYEFASLLPNYVPYQLLPYGSGLSRVDPKQPESNVYQYSNFVFVRNDVPI